MRSLTDYFANDLKIVFTKNRLYIGDNRSKNDNGDLLHIFELSRLIRGAAERYHERTVTERTFPVQPLSEAMKRCRNNHEVIIP